MDGKLEIGWRQPEGKPGVVANGKGLVEFKGESLKEGSIEGGRNSSVSGYEGDGTFIVDEGLEGNVKLGVCFVEDRGGEVWPADSDKGFIRVEGLNPGGGIEPSGQAGERRKALGGGSLKEIRDFNSGGTRRHCLRFGLAFAPGGVLSGSLIKLPIATMNDISVGAGVSGGTGVL